MTTQTITILNADDSAATRYARTHLLRQAGFEVIEAQTGAEALRMVAELKPQLVMMDVHLPDMSGLEVTRRIKADPASMRTPVVQVSATFITEHDRTVGLEGGAEVYLTEPVEPQELLTVVRTLLRLRTAEKGLIESESRWRRLFGANVIGIFVAQHTRIIEVNEVFAHLTGVDRARIEASNVDLSSLTPVEFHASDVKALVEVQVTGSFAAYEKEFLHTDGRRIRVLMGGASLNGGGDRWMGFVLDISERRRVEAEREELLRSERAARQDAERAARLKDEFLANLSHELRTPMSTITGWLHLLRTGRLDKEQSGKALEAIERATKAQNQLIADLLDVSRIVAGKLSLDREVGGLRSILDMCIESIALTAQAKGVAVQLQSFDEDITILADRTRLQQVFSNLLSNAVKFTPPGGRIDINVSASDTFVRVEVSDTGVGISAEFLPYVFDRFRQADGSISRQHGGMGLGLAIARHVVELHGGRVAAHSAGEGRGATFTVELPLADVDAERTVVMAQSVPEYANSPLRGIEILLIDDDADAREVTTAVLIQAGANCWAASRAADALSLLERWEPHVLVSDIGMAGIDGYDFIGRLRARGTHALPALALTAFARQEDRERALASGFDAHITKPIDPQQLVEAILKLAGKSPE